MEYESYIRQGLNGDAPLKVILCGEVDHGSGQKVGVVSLVYATTDKEKVEEKLRILIEQNQEKYYMVYSVPMDLDLTTLDHYPSIEISKEDLE